MRTEPRQWMPPVNAEFMKPATTQGSAFVPWIGGALNDILCEQYSRTGGCDHCVTFEGIILKIPGNDYRCNYIKVKVRTHRYLDGTLAVFLGPRKLAAYDRKCSLQERLKVENQ